MLEQTAATARCPASFIRFGPQVVGDRAYSYLTATRTREQRRRRGRGGREGGRRRRRRRWQCTTRLNGEAPNGPNAEENLPLSSFSSLFSRPSSLLFPSLPPSLSFPAYLFLLSVSPRSCPQRPLRVSLSLSFSLALPFPPPTPFFPFLVPPSIIPITRPDPAKIVSAVLDFAYGSFQQRDATAPRPSSVQVHRPGSVQVALPSR